MAKRRLTKEQRALFEQSPTQGFKSKVEVAAQRFVIDSPFGRLDCEYDGQVAVDELNAFFRGLILDYFEQRFIEIESRYSDWDEFLNDKDTQRLLAHSRRDREKYVRHAVNLLAEQVQPALEAALAQIVRNVKRQTLRELDGQTALPEFDAQQLRELDTAITNKAMRASVNPPQSGRPRVNLVRFKAELERAVKAIKIPKDVKKKVVASNLGITPGALRERCRTYNVNLDKMLKAQKKNLLILR
jgi:hypothetical protein